MLLNSMNKSMDLAKHKKKIELNQTLLTILHYRNLNQTNIVYVSITYHKLSRTIVNVSGIYN